MSQAILRIAWKDYRALLSFWISVALFAVVLQQVFSVLPDNYTFPGQSFYIALIFTGLYALGCGAAMFAGEKEDNTWEFLRVLPASGNKIFLGKLLLAIVSTLLMLGLLWIFALRSSGGLGQSIFTQPNVRLHLSVWGIAIIEALAWAMFFSLFTMRPLLAACLGAAGAVLAFLFIQTIDPSAFTQEYHIHDSLWEELYKEPILFYRLVLALGILGLTFVLGTRWLHEESVKNLFHINLHLREITDTLKTAVRFNWLPHKTAVLGRLVWQHFHHMLTIWGAIIFLGILIAFPHIVRPGLSFGSEISMAIAALLGATVFLSDQQKQSFRFLANHGASATQVWLARQASGLMVVFVWCAITSILYWFRHNDIRSAEDLYYFSLYIVRHFFMLVLTYSAGQFCSLLIRSGLVAVVASVLLAALIYSWYTVMVYCGISWLGTVLPIPFILFAASWLRCRSWLIQRNTIRSWTGVVLTVVLPMALITSGTAFYRAVEITSVDDELKKKGFNAAIYSRPASPEEVSTARLYQAAREEFISYDRIASQWEDRKQKEDKNYYAPFFDTGMVDPAKKLRPEFIDWLETNITTGVRLLMVTKRPTCLFFDPVTGSHLEHDHKWYFSTEMLLLGEGQRLLENCDIDQSRQYYIATLRFRAHVQQRNPLRWNLAENELLVYQHLAKWADHPGQTNEQLKQLQEDLRAFHYDAPLLESYIGANYVLMQRIVQGDVGAMSLFLDDRTGLVSEDRNQLFWLPLAVRLMPWESARAERLLRTHIRNSLAGLDWAKRTAKTFEIIWGKYKTPWGNSGSYRHQIGLPWYGEKSFLLRKFYPYMCNNIEYSYFQQEKYRLAIRMQLALTAWKLEHGSLPDRIEQLVPEYLEDVPKDPMTGKLFDYVPQSIEEILHIIIPEDPTQEVTPLKDSENNPQDPEPEKPLKKEPQSIEEFLEGEPKPIQEISEQEPENTFPELTPLGKDVFDLDVVNSLVL